MKPQFPLDWHTTVRHQLAPPSGSSGALEQDAELLGVLRRCLGQQAEVPFSPPFLTNGMGSRSVTPELDHVQFKTIEMI